MGVKILHVTSTLGGGGVAQLLLNYLQELSDEDVTFDFIVHGDRVGEHESYISSLGSQIFHAPPKREKPIANLSYISRIISEGNYDVVHAHQNLSNLVPMLLAKHHKVPVRISHGHGYPSLFRPVAYASKKGIEKYATDYFACTQEVGQWLHPTNWTKQSDRSFVMRNAIQMEKFTFNDESRAQWRNKLNLRANPLVIQVGRLSEEKNHYFTFSLLERLRKRGPWNLIIVGEGPMEKVLKQRVRELDLEGLVHFLGFQSDIPGLLCAADLAVMPSTTEGLALASIEPQVSGIPFAASNVLPNEVKMTDSIKLLPLDIDTWDAEINDEVWINAQRQTIIREPLQPYNIKFAAKEYISYINNALNRREIDR